MVQRTGVRGIRQTGRAAQGVTLMNVREEDRVSAVALVVESEASTSAIVAGDAPLPDEPLEVSADAPAAAPDGDGRGPAEVDASDDAGGPNGDSPSGD
jgi:DNA gyrase subunit A